MVASTALAALVGCLSVTLAQCASAEVPPKKPNIIMIISDDQDLLMRSLDFQPNVQKLLRDKGASFERHYCTIAQCCPSRVSLLTGRAAHNTNVTDVREPFGRLDVQVVKKGVADAAQVVTQSSCRRVSTVTGCHHGSRIMGITPPMLES